MRKNITIGLIIFFISSLNVYGESSEALLIELQTAQSKIGQYADLIEKQRSLIEKYKVAKKEILNNFEDEKTILIDKFKNDIDSINSQKNTVEEKNMELQEYINGLKNTNINILQKSGVIENTNNLLKKEVTVYKKDIGILENKLNKLQQVIDSNLKKKDNLEKKLKTEVEKIAKKFKKEKFKNEELKGIKTEKNKLAKELTKFRISLKYEEKGTEDLKDKLKNAQKEFDEKEKDYDLLNKELLEIKKEKQNLIDKLDVLQSNSKIEKQKLLEIFENEKTILSQQLNQADKKIAYVDESKKIYIIDLVRVKADLSDANKTIDQLNKANQNLIKENRMIEAKIYKLGTNLSKKALEFDEVVSKYKKIKQKKVLENTIAERLIAAKDNEIVLLQTELNDLTNHMNETNKKTKNLLISNKGYEQRLYDLEKDKNELKIELKFYEGNNKELNTDVARIKEESEKITIWYENKINWFKKNLEDNEIKYKLLLNIKKELEQKTKNLEKLLNNKEENKESILLEKEVLIEKHVIDKLQKENEGKQKDFADLRKEIDPLTKSLKKQENVFEKNDNQEIEEKVENNIDKKQSFISKLKNIKTKITDRIKNKR
jgi:chromosome segregation ATPase